MSSSFETNQPNVAISIPQETPTGSQATTPNATPGRERSTSSGSWHPNASAGISQARTGKVFYHDGVVDSNNTGQGRQGRKSFSQGLPVTIRESTGMANRRSHLWFWIHNGAELLALVFAWAACITAFAGVLHTFANGQAHWDHGVINNVGVAWKGNNSKCESIGAGYVAMYAISFIFLNLALGAMVYRLITKSMTASAMKAELACYALSFFFMFIAVPIWSGCIAETESISNSSAKWTGYAYQIFALIGMFLGMGPLLAIYNNDSYQSLHNNFPTKY